MEPELLHFTLVFLLGAVVGIAIMLLVNKVRSGSAAPRNVQEEFDSYQAEVERHFEETSKKFKDMTEQYQDLYQHLSIGATSLCRPDSVAATLADARSPMDKLVDLSDPKQKSAQAKPVNAESKTESAPAASKSDLKPAPKDSEQVKPAVKAQADEQSKSTKPAADKKISTDAKKT